MTKPRRPTLLGALLLLALGGPEPRFGLRASSNAEYLMAEMMGTP